MAGRAGSSIEEIPAPCLLCHFRRSGGSIGGYAWRPRCICLAVALLRRRVDRTGKSRSPWFVSGVPKGSAGRTRFPSGRHYTGSRWPYREAQNMILRKQFWQTGLGVLSMYRSVLNAFSFPWTPVLILFVLGAAIAQAEFPDISQLPSRPDLPDPLVMLDGERIMTKEQWVNKAPPGAEGAVSVLHVWLPARSTRQNRMQDRTAGRPGARWEGHAQRSHHRFRAAGGILRSICCWSSPTSAKARPPLFWA